MEQTKDVAPEDFPRELCIPVGTLELSINHPAIFEKETRGVFLEIPAGQQYFRLERYSNFILKFFHSSPATGTRVATIDLTEIAPAKVLRLQMGWSPKEMGFSVCALYKEDKVLIGHGVKSDVEFRVGLNGQVFAVGGPGIQVAGTRFTQGGKNILEPTAIQAWEEILKAIDILSTGKSNEGFRHY